jgi:hypothetical protein
MKDRILFEVAHGINTCYIQVKKKTNYLEERA